MRREEALGGRTESFLLTQDPAGAIPLAEWLTIQSRRPQWGAELRLRRRVLREAGKVLRRVHDAGYCGPATGDRFLVVRHLSPDSARPQAVVALGSLDGLQSRRRLGPGRVKRDLAALRNAFSPLLGGRTDALRFLLGYLALERLTPGTRHFAFFHPGAKHGKRS